jgi:DNA modification methylase
LPTPQTYNDLIPLVKDPNFKIKPYNEIRQEYESLRQEYESLRYTFNNIENHHSVWDYNLESQTIKGDHPTPKPLELIKTILKYSSNENNIILDPFLGSGSTLIACEQTNRICYGMEIDEHYCSVIIKRWELYTGLKASKMSE